MRYVSASVKRINDVPIGVLMLVAFTCAMMVLSIFKSTASNAEVVLAPNSFISTDGETAKVVEGQPEQVDGKPVKYEKTNVIPISPKVAVRDTKTGAFKKDVPVTTHQSCLPGQPKAFCDSKVRK